MPSTHIKKPSVAPCAYYPTTKEVGDRSRSTGLLASQSSQKGELRPDSVRDPGSKCKLESHQGQPS